MLAKTAPADTQKETPMADPIAKALEGVELTAEQRAALDVLMGEARAEVPDGYIEKPSEDTTEDETEGKTSTETPEPVEKSAAFVALQKSHDTMEKRLDAEMLARERAAFVTDNSSRFANLADPTATAGQVFDYGKSAGDEAGTAMGESLAAASAQVGEAPVGTELGTGTGPDTDGSGRLDKMVKSAMDANPTADRTQVFRDLMQTPAGVAAYDEMETARMARNAGRS